MSTVHFLLCGLGFLAVMLTGCFAPSDEKATEQDHEEAVQVVKQRDEQDAMLPQFVRLVAEDVRLSRECDSGQTLLSQPDYVKVPICDKCHAGKTFLTRPSLQGGGIFSCSACGSGALVIKMSSDAQKKSCAQVAEVQRQEKEAQQEAGISSEVFAIVRQWQEDWYDCNAGDQQACRNGCTSGYKQVCQMVK
jgi:hypothetical protein